MKRIVLIIILLALYTGVTVGAQATAQTMPNRAALVVRFDDQRTEIRCVEFTEPEITGLELLQRSGLALAVDYQAGGAAICSIGNTGCPADDCFCQCRGGPDCVYWSYWLNQNNAWTYSVGGTGMITVRDGDLNGWSWGPGSVTDAIPPQATTFDAVCSSDPPPTDTPVPTSPPLILPTLPGPGGGATMPTMTIAPTTTATPTQPPTVQPTATAVATLLPAVTTVPAATRTPAAGAGGSGVVPTPTAIAVAATPETEVEIATLAEPDATEPEGGDAVEPDSAVTTDPMSEPAATSVPAVTDNAAENDAPDESVLIENEEESLATDVAVAVVGASVAEPEANAVHVSLEQEEEDSSFPAAEYALFGALVAMLAAAFGLVYLRRGSSPGQGT